MENANAGLPKCIKEIRTVYDSNTKRIPIEGAYNFTIENLGTTIATIAGIIPLSAFGDPGYSRYYPGTGDRLAKYNLTLDIAIPAGVKILVTQTVDE